MIGQLTGTIEKNNRNPLIIDVGGVGYLVQVTEKFASSVKPKEHYTLYIHTHVREEAFDLYGFTEENELALFELLLTVSGIGPKTALSIINRGAGVVEQAVKKSDVDFFTTIPRLGKKNAQKIIIELKNKLGGIHDLDLVGENNGETKQMMEALLSMGFRRHEIVEVLGRLEAKSYTLEQKMREALKLLGK